MDELRKATYEAVKASGPQILRAPQRFIGYVTDIIDPESYEARLLYSACDAEYLGFFASAMESGAPADVAEAIERSVDYLYAQYVTDKNYTRAVSWQIAAGIADVLGVTVPEKSAAQQAKHQAQDQTQFQVQPQPNAGITAVPMQPQPVSSAPINQPRVAQPLTQDVSVGGNYQAGQNAGWQTSAQPQVQPGWTSAQPQAQPAYPQAPAAPKKKSHGFGIAAIVGLVAVTIIVSVIARSLGQHQAEQMLQSYDTPAQTSPDPLSDTSSDNDAESNSDLSDDATQTSAPVDADPDEGTLTGLNFSQIEVSDTTFGDLKAVLVHNSNSLPLRVTSDSGETFIESINAGGDGFFLMDRGYAIMDDIEVDAAESSSVEDFLTWSESRVDSKVVITVYNSSDSYLSFDTLFYFVAYSGNDIRYWRTNWVNDESGNILDSIAPGENTYTISGDIDGVFDLDYDLYINGVKIPRT